MAALLHFLRNEFNFRIARVSVIIYHRVAVNTKLPLFRRILVCGITIVPSVSEAWQPGTYPAAPQRMHSSGFSVNNQDRNDVVAFWHAVYQASEGYESRINWTGNYSGNNGTTSPEFVQRRRASDQLFPRDVRRGFVRAGEFRLHGRHRLRRLVSRLPPATLKSTAAQDAALMLNRNYNSKTGVNPAITHNPPPNLTGWSAGRVECLREGKFRLRSLRPRSDQ